MTGRLNQFSTEWTADRVETLKRLWTAKLSQQEIADELGVTRNTIAGKISRLKLTRAPSEKVARAPRKRPSTGRPNPATAWIGRAPIAEIVEEPAAPGGISLMQLTNETCRWPSGVVGTEDFSFCGAGGADLNASRPYCRAHARMARKL